MSEFRRQRLAGFVGVRSHNGPEVELNRATRLAHKTFGIKRVPSWLVIHTMRAQSTNNTSRTTGHGLVPNNRAQHTICCAKLRSS